MKKAILSPCIGVCTLDGRGHCTGCFRSTDEIANWLHYSDAQRARLMNEVLPEREDAAAIVAKEVAPSRLSGMDALG